MLFRSAAVEGIVGVIGLLFHDVFGVASVLAYDTLFPALGGGALLLVGKWLLAALLIVPQSVLLGTTFPLMTAGVLRRLGDPAAQLAGSGQVLGLLYFTNSFGAAVGVLISGFYLIGLAGLPGTLVVAAILNLVVALGTFGLVRLEQDDEPATATVATAGHEAGDGETAPAPPARVDDARALDAAASVAAPGFRSPLARLLLAVAFGTAVASFI